MSGHSIVDVGRWLAQRFGVKLESDNDFTLHPPSPFDEISAEIPRSYPCRAVVGPLWQGVYEPRTRQEEPMDEPLGSHPPPPGTTFTEVEPDRVHCSHCKRVSSTVGVPDGAGLQCGGCMCWGRRPPRARTAESCGAPGPPGTTCHCTKPAGHDGMHLDASALNAWETRAESERKILLTAIEAAEANNRILAKRLERAEARVSAKDAERHKTQVELNNANRLLEAVNHEVRVLVDELDGAWWLKAAAAVDTLKRLSDPSTDARADTA